MSKVKLGKLFTWLNCYFSCSFKLKEMDETKEELTYTSLLNITGSFILSEKVFIINGMKIHQSQEGFMLNFMFIDMQ
jgi:hypothetical protein